MDIGLILISIVFLILVFFRIYDLKKKFYLFGYILRGKKAVISRIISALIMLVLAYGLIFHYLWAFWLFVLDFIIGLVGRIMILINASNKKSEYGTSGLRELAIKSNIFYIIFWTVIMIYVYSVYF